MAGFNGADVYINSPGGNLLAGMEIGRLLRDAGANTRVGTLVADDSLDFLGKPGVKHLPGQCFSACILAFLGGVYRFGTKESEYGVHRFSSRLGPASSDFDLAQIISAAVGAYIREMDVDPGLFDLMVEEGKERIRMLDGMELARLNVVNNGRKKPEWSIEAIEGAQYLRGMQDTAYGQGKALMACDSQRLFLQSYYFGGSKRSPQIATGSWHHELVVSGKTFPLGEPVHIMVRGPLLITSFYLTREQALAITLSSSISHQISPSSDSFMYFGYSIDIPKIASGKVNAFIRNCITN